MIDAYLKRRCRDTAVYWGSPTSRADGSNQYTTPIEIACFWVDQTDLNAQRDGKTVSILAVVHVLQDLAEQGMLFHGTLSSLSDDEKDDPRKVSRAYEITSFIKTPSMTLIGQFNRNAMISPRNNSFIRR